MAIEAACMKPAQHATPHAHTAEAKFAQYLLLGHPYIQCCHGYLPKYQPLNSRRDMHCLPPDCVSYNGFDGRVPAEKRGDASEPYSLVSTSCCAGDK